MSKACQTQSDTFGSRITRRAGRCLSLHGVPPELLGRALAIVRKLFASQLAPDRFCSGLVSELRLAERLEVFDLLGRRTAWRGTKLRSPELLEERERRRISLFGVKDFGFREE